VREIDNRAHEHLGVQLAHFVMLGGCSGLWANRFAVALLGNSQKNRRPCTGRTGEVLIEQLESPSSSWWDSQARPTLQLRL